ncbi:Cob(I)yrinic acid a,c-diamide adenosyltransferase [Oxobacter pfennigii]|uniref:Cob(I)yrinic acid a,c-diamide adenosyltransferase n=1 Tax=Oxobacter pfennigii TaxID=36849 RepID=A0A0P8YUF6_9CLOT|nr:cob(I)yrinic acid a,c-diamide adenosyltransferase [Oxobacter pfennigii]KPU43329.1 Cob(I)yrinic acid a,c-diamide adenosyltransferase [Oxobacter pfennigii]
MDGLVHIYTGYGKGKTTAAVGLGIRACGRGKKVLMVQFLKGIETGEMLTIEKLKPDFEIYRCNKIENFIWDMTGQELANIKEYIENLFCYAVKEAMSGKRDLIILDEIMAAILSGYITVAEVVSFVKNKPAGLELVMTGRDAPLKIIRVADYVSEIKAVKHPYEEGIHAREGIEF